MAKIFISHKTSELNNQHAQGIYGYLVSKGHKVFLDIRELTVGVKWNNAIYTEISESDILLLMITEDVISPWVRREVDFARGNRIRILPLVVRDNDLIKDASGQDNASKVMNELAISDIHYAKALSSINNPEYRFAELLAAIENLASETRAEQQEWVNKLRDKWAKQDKSNPLLNPPKKIQSRFASYAFIQENLQPHKCRIHLTAGDITQLDKVDVLVNSENVYMQMQRVFAPPSVSKTIRLAGAKKRSSNSLEEDTIQEELNVQLFGATKKGVPVDVGDVFVTSAGHTHSELQEQGIRYIFHVAAVEANTRTGEQKFTDGDAYIIKRCVLNCFRELEKLNHQNPLDVVQSIAFPLLGTGNAGLKVEVGAENIIEGFKEYLSNNVDTALQNIYLCAYTLGDTQTVEKILASNFKQV